MKRIKQKGKTTKIRDKMLKAKRPGWRKSAKGKKYFENRANRSDINPRLRF